MIQNFKEFQKIQNFDLSYTIEMDHFKREVGGFDFELTRRNDVALGKMKLQLPKYRKTGTTLAGGTSRSLKIEKSTFFESFSLSLHLSQI